MEKIFIIGLIIAVALLTFSACSKNRTTQSTQGDIQNTQATQSNTFEQITPEKAKEIMDTQKNYVILDVRTAEEFQEGHIKGAILIPDYEIVEKAEEILTDKEQLILVYCRSGRRSKLASQELANLGYTNVKEFGGIIDWEYGIVTE